MLLWDRFPILVLIGSKKMLRDPTRVIWIRSDRGRHPEDLGYRKIKVEKIKQAGNMIC